MVSLEERLAAIDNLPTLSPAVAKLIGVLNDESLSADDFEEILRTDTSLSAAVLKAANSSLYGFEGEVASLSQAVSRLGSKNLHRVVLTYGVTGALSKGGVGYGLTEQDARVGSLGGAIAAEAIAAYTGLEDPGLCFTAALLRDIGKLAMDVLIDPVEFEQLLCGRQKGWSQMALEVASFGFDHAQAGATLASMWRLPDRLIEVIRYHHTPPSLEVADDPLIDVVHCADMVCVWLGYGVGHDGLSYQLSERSRERVGLDRGDLEVYLSQVSLRLDQMLEELFEEKEEAA